MRRAGEQRIREEKRMKSEIRHFRDLEVYRRAFAAAMKIYAEKFCF